MSKSRETLGQAIAYLKIALPPEPQPGEAVVDLSHEDSPVLRELGNGLLVAYLIDEGSRFGYVQYRDLASSGVSESELHEIGIKNLYALADERLRIESVGPIFALFLDGNFEASVLLLDDLWDHSLAEHVQGDFLVAVPARDVLAFGDASSPAAVSEVRAVISRLIAAGSAELATVPYRRKARAWVAHDA